MAVEGNIGLRDVGNSAGTLARTAGTYTCQKFNDLGVWAKDHKSQIAIALIVTGIAIACFCAGGSVFAALALVKLQGLTHFLALNEFLASSSWWWIRWESIACAMNLTSSVAAITDLFAKILWVGAIGTGVGVTMLSAGLGLKSSASNAPIEQKASA